MALTTQSVSIGGATKNIIVGADASGNIAPGHVLVNAAGAEIGTSVAPLYASTVLTAGSAAIGGVTQSGAWSVGLASGTNTIGAVNVIGGNVTAVKTDGSAITQPVSAASLPLPAGAATAAKQPALGVAGTASADVITVQGIAAMTALKVDGSAVTQPVSATTLPLPTGAATAAKQPALGVAGTPSADVLSIQGVAGGTALPVSGTFWQATQPVSAASLPLPAGAATAANQPVINADGGAQTHVMNFPATQAVTGTFWQATQPVSGTVALGAGAAAIGSVSVSNLPATQPVSGTVSTSPSASSIATGQVSVGTAATLIVAARAARQSVTIIQEGTTLVRVGASGVTLTTGVPLPGTAYSQLDLPGGAAIYGIVGTGSQTVSFVEVF